MPASLEIVPISPIHLPFCNAIASTAPDPWSAESIAAELTLQNHSGFAALAGGTVAGFAFFSKDEHRVDLLQIVVAAEFRAQGIGEFLLSSVLDIFRAKGAETCTLEVRAGNTHAIRLYKKLGFNILATRKNLYENPPENGYLMQKML